MFCRHVVNAVARPRTTAIRLASTSGSHHHGKVHHDEHHDDHHHEVVGYEPGGYLFGRKPLPNGQKHEKYWWENMWYYGYYGPFAVYFLLEAFSPKRDIQENVTREAQRRMLARGETFDYPFPPSYKIKDL